MVKNMKNVKSLVLKSSVVATTFAAAAAHADTATQITEAVTAGTTNYGTVVAGVVSLAALGFGVGLIVRSLSR